ncbi:MAG: ABC transporter ATP-binding protein [Chloroflexota bacterium]
MASIEASGLTRQFGERLAVDGLSLRVEAGELLALLGPNGAGKTTTVRMLAGLLAPTSGHATVAGYDVISEPDAVRRQVGLVTDRPGLYPRMTAPAYLRFFGQLYGLDGAPLRRRVDELLSFFALDEHRRERLDGFSKGMQQKVALARALLHDPSVLFLDEPTSGLDPLAARAVHELILDLKQGQRGMVLCTHDLDEAEALADQVAIVRAGQLVASDTPAALRTGATAAVGVRVELDTDAPSALRALADVAGLDNLGSRPATNGAGMAIEYATREPRQVNPVVVARLVDAGARVITVTTATPSLEQVYADVVAGPSARKPWPAVIGRGDQ